VLPVLGDLGGKRDARDLAHVVLLDRPLAVLVLNSARAVGRLETLLVAALQARRERAPNDRSNLGVVRRIVRHRIIELGERRGELAEDAGEAGAPVVGRGVRDATGSAESRQQGDG